MSHPAVHLGHGLLWPAGAPVEGGYVTLSGERSHRIRHVDAMPPFLMSLVGASDLWMFVSSSGGLTAGRVDADGALFPYVTEDRLTEGFDHTGPKTVLQVTRGERRSLWEPFSDRGRGVYRVERNLYKSALGDEVRFEEINHDLGLAFRYAWRGSDAFGFVRTAELEETTSEPCAIELLDGLQNLLPAGVTAAMQAGMSNLVDAYKRNELEPASGLGLFALSSILTDLAEPSEALRATTVFALGLEGARHLLSSGQLAAFRQGVTPVQEIDQRGRRGAYFVHAVLTLAPEESRRWRLVAEVGQDHAGVVALAGALRRSPAELDARVEDDLRRSREALEAIVASADGFQWTRDRPTTDHHLASVLFNVMRGGVFVDDDRLERADLVAFLRTRNPAVLASHAAFFRGLPETLAYHDLVARAVEAGSSDLERLCRAYLPLAFSRRHGDPSRPWNRFTINVRHPDGRLRLDHQGNWRDIFQNWEALAHAFPGFLNGMVSTFLGATTADGYNPYRVTRDGIEWEVPEPDAAWSNIGYWSDHQVVYLQRLLEASERFDPGALAGILERRIFSHANVPYRIAPYEAMLDDPYDTIEFDAELDRRIAAAVAAEGTDARLLKGPDGAIVHVSMAEKLLLLLLVKLANLVPEGGIWMNTQRPEWNDANNALVGKGLSVVTTAYLYRTVVFLQGLLAGRDLTLSREVADFLDAVHDRLRDHEPVLAGAFDDRRRRAFMDALGGAGSAYRRALYARGLSGDRSERNAATVTAFLELARAYLEHTLRANRRDDALYHAYNVLAFAVDGAAGVRHLDEMLEGQVAVLSSGLLSSAEVLELLASLRRGRLYRADQHSYVLYPDRDLPGFLAKNTIPAERVASSALLTALVAAGDTRIVVRDENGDVHFHAGFRNAKGVRRALADLAADDRWAAAVAAGGDAVVRTFEEVFDHAAFTGRSGTFFAYEGLGSIYWHMVSKLLLAVQECYFRACDAGEPGATLAALAAAYDDVRAGLGFHKTPAEFGAFPTDPYSHTPAHAGAQQPGMTGQVKEDVLARLGELGVEVRGGRLGFAPTLLGREEFVEEPTTATVRAIGGAAELRLDPGTLAFTFCQVPVVYRLTDGGARVELTGRDGTTRVFDGPFLDAASSREVFERRGTV
ncbi:MAG: hypothetical protein K0A98_05545, partial [Trueperaceae bacterium]|nr:hypothetical protein [Trueperaceae bacterium]